MTSGHDEYYNAKIRLAGKWRRCHIVKRGIRNGARHVKIVVSPLDIPYSCPFSTNGVYPESLLRKIDKTQE